jgi:hypothetical protein
MHAEGGRLVFVHRNDGQALDGITAKLLKACMHRGAHLVRGVSSTGGQHSSVMNLAVEDGIK